MLSSPRSGRRSPGCVAIRLASGILLIVQAKKGGFKDTSVEDLLTAALKGVLDKSGIDPKLIEDVAVGSVLSPGQYLPTY